MNKRFFHNIRNVFILIIIFSIFFIIGNLIVFYYFDFKKPISGETNQADLDFTIEAITVEPTPAPGGAAVSASGGGGGGISAKVPFKKKTPEFNVDQTLIKVASKIGEVFKKSVTISNPSDELLHFKLSTSLEGIVYVSEIEFDIPPNSDQTIFLTFIASEDLEPDVYTGKLIISTQYTEKEIPVIYEIRTKRSLFDVSLNIPAEYKTIIPGDDVLFQVTLLNLGDIGNVDVELEYSIKDFEGNVIKTLSDTVALEKQISFSKSISLPENTPFGDYVVAVRAKFGLTVGTASDVFSVISRDERNFRYYTLLAFIILFIILIIIIYKLQSRRLKKAIKEQENKLAEIRRKVTKGKIEKNDIDNEINKLKRQYSLLEEAYKKGYIKKQSFEDSKNKINSLIGRLKKRL